MAFDAMFFGELVAVIMIVSAYSFWWKRTVLFRFATSLFVAVTTGYSLSIAVKNVMDSAITPISKGNIVLIIPFLLSILFFARLNKKTAYLTRFPTAIAVGVGIAVSTYGAISTGILRTLSRSWVSWQKDPYMLITFVLFICSTFYYLFHRKFRSVPGTKIIAKIGMIAIMITMGVGLAQWAITGSTLMWFWVSRVLRFIGLG